MAVKFIGCEPFTPVDRNARYRLTWIVVAAKYLPDAAFDTVSMDHKVQEALPALGFLPITMPVAMAGDPFIQYRVKILTGFNGQTVADVVQQANRLPALSGLISLRAALEVSEVEIVPNVDSTMLYALDAASRKRAMEAAAADDIVTKVQDLGSGIGRGIGDVAKFAIVAIVLGIGGYFLVKSKI